MSDDVYSTRTGERQIMFPRKDPVIHLRNQARWNGPLAEATLSHYERDGFLWFERFSPRNASSRFSTN